MAFNTICCHVKNDDTIEAKIRVAPVSGQTYLVLTIGAGIWLFINDLEQVDANIAALTQAAAEWRRKVSQ